MIKMFLLRTVHWNGSYAKTPC